MADAVGRKRKVLQRGEGPVLLETLTYRFSGHSPSDASSYRTRQEIELWRQRDCISAFGKYLIENGVTTPDDLEAEGAKIREKIRKTLERAVDPQRSPYIQAEEIGGVMFSNLALPKRNERDPEVRIPLHENPRVQSIMRKTRFGLDGRGIPLPGARTFYGSRWLVRGARTSIPSRSYFSRVWRGEPRLGWGFWRLQRPYGVAALSSPL